MSIFKVNSNFKHNGQPYQKDTVFEGTTEEFGHLAEAGVLTIVEGAKNVDEAVDIIVEEAKKDDEKEKIEIAPENTWGPQPDKDVADARFPVEEVKPIEENKVPIASEEAKKEEDLGNNL